ncbi:MAG: HD domain-containing protein, partial [Acholeplasmataceae bacterium]|nr:HD domain-containing protein [Acholeplasmataceae bacterium]
MDDVLKQYLEDNIINLYQQFDLAHQKDHVYKVIEHSLEIAKDYEVNLDMVYVIACYHDIGMKFGRNDHHLTGGQFLYEDSFLKQFFRENEMIIMKEAVEDHRASRAEAPRNIYGKIIAEADRDIEPNTIILRTVQFGFKHYPDLSEDEHLQRAFDHIKEKYGPDGYLNLWLETKKNREGLNTIHALL